VNWKDKLRLGTSRPAPARPSGYQALMDLVDDGFCIIQFIDGPDGPLSDYVHIESNSGYERHTGIPGIVGKTVFDVSPQDGAEWVKIYRRVLDTGQPIRFERRFAEIDRHIEVSATLADSVEQGRVAVLFRDITERKRAEEALRDSEQRATRDARHLARALSAGAILGTWIWALDTDHFELDTGFSQAMGLDPEQPASDLTLEMIVSNVHPSDRPALMEEINRAISERAAIAFQFRVRQADGQYHWIETNGRLEGTSPRIFAGVLMDLDERRAILAERDRATAELFHLNQTLEQRVAEQTSKLMEQEEALRQAQKMEAVGQLTGGLAHDFNNLLTAIAGSLELITSRLDEGRTDEAHRFVEAALASTERAATVTQRLLAFSRRQSLLPAPTDVPALVRGMEDLVRRAIGPQVSVTTRFATDMWPAMVDGNQLENALLNICLNARDAMPDGGLIEIEAGNETFDAGTEHLAAGAYVKLSVRDSGSGMTPEQLAKAFDPYFTTKPSGKGTGLGLSMVYGFARQTGGAALIRSQLGKGTTVELFLPRSEQAVETAGPPAGLADAPEGSGATILVVDDEVLVRMVVAESLTDAGFKVLEAGTARDGLALLEAHPEISALLTDVGLPGGMTGRELARAARDAHPDLGIMFMTGYDDEASSGPALAGAEVLLKPFAFDVMVRRMVELTSGA